LTSITSANRKDSKSLSPELVLATALQLVRENGMDFSMRDLAGRLNVWPMAIYRHYENRDALVEAIVEAVLKEALDAETLANLANDSTAWKIRLEHFALRLFDLLVTYPGVSKVITYGALHTPSGLRLIEIVADFLVSIGVAKDRAAIMFQTAAFLVAEMAGLQYARDEGKSDLEGLMRRSEEAKAEFPAAYSYIQHFATSDLRERMLNSLRLFLRAVEAEIEDTRA